MEDNDKEHIQIVLNHIPTKEQLSIQQLLLLSLKLPIFNGGSFLIFSSF